MFEISMPRRYSSSKDPIAGWQDSLEEIIHKYTNIDLGVVFESSEVLIEKVIDGIHYYPICPSYSLLEKWRNYYSWDVSKRKLLPQAALIIDKFHPDIIHVFGSEWCWGQVSKFVNVPVVVHMQGSIPSYLNAFYPPNYNMWDQIFATGLNIKKQLSLFLQRYRYVSWKKQEEETLKTVCNFMGRTLWDKQIVKFHNPISRYFYCSEALRSIFYEMEEIWKPRNNTKIRIVTVGCSSFWKGCDTIIKTSHLLMKKHFEFEWIVVGNMSIKCQVEHKERLLFSEQNVVILGFQEVDKVVELLYNSDIYVHTAYIDNSPNSLCEAQYIGLPIIATYVGGIPSLIENDVDGLLVPANDPYQLAQLIIDLSTDKRKQARLGLAAANKARKRHNPQNIINDLLYCYNSIVSQKAEIM